MDELRIKRVYEEAAQDDGFRVLVDRVWPRGVSRQKANIDVWMKSVAPSTELRKWFGHDRERWDEFKSRYFDELDNGPAGLDQLLRQTRDGIVTLVYSARDTENNQAVALKEYLQARLGN